MKSKILLTVKTWQEDQYFVAYNPELDIASQGKTVIQAQENLREAVDLFLETTKKWELLIKRLKKRAFW